MMVIEIYGRTVTVRGKNINRFPFLS